MAKRFGFPLGATPRMLIRIQMYTNMGTIMDADSASIVYVSEIVGLCPELEAVSIFHMGAM